MIEENKYIDQIANIWQENNQGYIGYNCNQRSINDNEMLKIVYVEDKIVYGYAVLYFGVEFCELERYPNKIENIPDKVIYIWEMVTSKNHLRQGIGTKIMNYITNKFKGYTIYSCINSSNTPSLRLHSKLGFNPIYDFIWEDNDEYTMMELKN